MTQAKEKEVKNGSYATIMAQLGVKSEALAKEYTISEVQTTGLNPVGNSTANLSNRPDPTVNTDSNPGMDLVLELTSALSAAHGAPGLEKIASMEMSSESDKLETLKQQQEVNTQVHLKQSERPEAQQQFQKELEENNPAVAETNKSPFALPNPTETPRLTRG